VSYYVAHYNKENNSKFARTKCLPV
jgi:hypothetical protein